MRFLSWETSYDAREARDKSNALPLCLVWCRPHWCRGRTSVHVKSVALVVVCVEDKSGVPWTKGNPWTQLEIPEPGVSSSTAQAASFDTVWL